MGHHGAAQSMSAGQNAGIGSSHPTVFLSCQYVMPQLTEDFNNRERKVFIRIKLHSLSLHKLFLVLFVLADGRFDLFRVRSGVSKGGFKVGGSESGIVT